MIGHNLRYSKGEMVSQMLKDMIEGKNWIRKPKQNYEVHIMKNTGCNYSLR